MLLISGGLCPVQFHSSTHHRGVYVKACCLYCCSKESLSIVVKPPSLAVGVTHQPSLAYGLLCSLLADFKTGAWLPRASPCACYLSKWMFELCSQPVPAEWGSMATDPAGRICSALFPWDPMGAYGNLPPEFPPAEPPLPPQSTGCSHPRLKYQVHNNICTWAADPS